MKIAIYEKELNEQKAELEYMQEQIRPHFFFKLSESDSRDCGCTGGGEDHVYHTGSLRIYPV